MKKIFLFNLIFLSPMIVFAAPLSGVFSCKADPCTLADIIGIIGQAIDYSIKIVVPLATLAFLYAGILMVTSPADSSNIGKAKKIIWDAVIGIVYVLAAYIIVKAVTQGLGGQNPEQYLKIIPK